jgi:enoyl-CoA hydratase/carnithine racemase
LSEGVFLERRGPLSVIRLSRPRVRNAMDLRMWKGLASRLREACSPRDPGSVVALAGSGGFFSSGDDVKALLALESPEEASLFFGALEKAFEELLRCGKPTMAILEGPAEGGGAELVLAVDYAIASRKAWLAYPEARLGLIPPALSTLGFILLGRRAWRLALAGEVLSAEKALELGILDEVVPPDELWPRAIEVAERLSQVPWRVAAAVRRASLRVVLPALRAAIAELEGMVLWDEAKARMKAFTTQGRRLASKPS